jgi:subtilase family serine protease
MQKLTAIALVAGLSVSACSGHAGTAALPQLNSQGQASSPQTSGSAVGAHSTRPASLAVAPAGWANTQTQTFNLKSAGDLGALAPTQAMTVRLGLQLHNVDAIQALVKSGQIVTPAQFKASYSPTASEVAQVTNYLQAQGLTNITVEPNNLLVSASGNAAQIAKAFATTLHSFSQNGVTVYANTAPAFVPSSLSGIVVAVLGLNNVQTYKTGAHKATNTVAAPVKLADSSGGTAPSPCALASISIIGLPSPVAEPQQGTDNAGCLRNYAPADYWRAYDAASFSDASLQHVAVMAQGDVRGSIADFRINETGDGLPQVQVVVQQVGVASPDTAGADEWTLDMTASSGMAGNVGVMYVYTTPTLTDSDIALEFNHWVTDMMAPIANASFGGCEFGPFLDGSMLVDDMIFLEGAALGMTLFASSGDTGSFCSVGTPNGVPAGVPLVEYPAASPYVVAVGGTTLVTKQDGSYQGEVPWYAGGGGVSQFEGAPYWELSVQTANSTGEATFRGVPDISMDADLQTGMIIYLSDAGGWTVIGGTSLASPLAVGAYARLLQAHTSLEFAPPHLYRAFSNSVAGTQTNGPPPTVPYGPYHDIIVGGNGAYTALPGYDYTTGMGTLDVAAMNATLGQ